MSIFSKRSKQVQTLIAVMMTLLVVLATPAVGQDRINFNRDIRPILSENCFFCHGQDAAKREADLRLDIRESALDSGSIVPNDTHSSELVARIFSDDEDMVMPPIDSNRHLSQHQRKLLRQWIEQGAEYSVHWAFVAPQRPREPKTANREWARNPIDRFILSRLELERLPLSPEADRTTLIKRLSIDLTGLPPTAIEIEHFVADASPTAYENLVDRLLASPHYGERMALPWLDAARYADSNGFQQDGDTWQWIWRDWVVQALNRDLPFDQFTIWQLAGDLLPNATTEQKIASGFNRNHLLNGEGGAIAEEQRFVNLFDRVDTTATTWLGLTMACAQCHDHKYDPITQREYYQMLDMFNRVPESGTPQRQSAKIRVAAPFIELPTDENKTRIAELNGRIADLQKQSNELADIAFQNWRTVLLSTDAPESTPDLPDTTVKLLSKSSSDRTDDENNSLETELRNHFDKKLKANSIGKARAVVELKKTKGVLAQYRGDQIPRPMIMSDAKPRQTSILDRGQYLSPGEKVSFGTPDFLPPMQDDAPKNRLGYANWLVSPKNPLVARVQVNRMWQYFFGTGLVKTSEDMGTQSEFPIHMDLLDWLAVEFRESGWSMKKINRLILTSATYRQSSRMTELHRQRDRDNRFYSRASRFRMPSMILRDWALATSGLLDDRIAGRPVYPYQPGNAWEALAITKERDFTYPTSTGNDLYRRSIYSFWRRTVGPANMFDASNRQACRVTQSSTSTPLHALTTLNDPTWVEAARILARNSLLHAPGNPKNQLSYAFRRVTCRIPGGPDLERLENALQKQMAIYRDDSTAAQRLLGIGAAPREKSLNEIEHAALTVVCLAILNLDEALTRE